MAHEALWKKKTGGNGARFDVGERGDGRGDKKGNAVFCAIQSFSPRC